MHEKEIKMFSTFFLSISTLHVVLNLEFEQVKIIMSLDKIIWGKNCIHWFWQILLLLLAST